MAIAFAPTSCNLSATSTIFIEFSSHPNLVLMVIGNLVRLHISLVSLTIKSMSFKMPAPAPFDTTFLTGHPKLISIMSGLTDSTMSTD